MAELLNHKWAPFKIGDIFDINKCDYGKDNKYELTDNISDMPVVSGQTTNNGVMGYVKREDIKSKIYKDCLTISTRGQYSGTVLYHEGEFTLNNNIMILALKEDKSTYVKLFLQVPLSNLGYGGYANYPKREEMMKREIFLPITPDGQPDYDFMENYIKQLYDDFADRVCVYQEPVSSDADISLSDREWKEFKVGDLFSIEKCKCGSASKLSDGTIPYVGATNRNNGVLRYVDAENKMITKGNCIAFICDGQGSVGHSIYKKESFVGSTTVKVGRNEKLNQYNGQFIVTVLETNADIYNYGYKRNDERLRNEIISLPVTADDQPDYDFMEQYIKSLPFSKAMEL